MAKVPDLFEDLKNCYSENEDYSSEIDHLSLNQKSFYDAKYDAFHKDCNSETSKTSKFTFKENVVVVTTNGKILKRRRLSVNQFFTDGDLEAITNDTEGELIMPRSISYNFQSNMDYNFRRTIKEQFILNDVFNESIIRAVSDQQYLKTAALQNLDDAVKFDMDFYMSEEDSKFPVALRISETHLFVSAQKEGEPVLLKEFSEKPKTIKGETNLLFFLETVGTKSYFKSVANPTLFLATKQDSWVHMARGQPSNIDFLILETQ